MNRCLKPSELAALLSVTDETALHLIRTGRIRAVQISPPGSKRPRFRVPADAVDEFLRGVQPQPSCEPQRRKRGQRIKHKFYT